MVNPITAAALTVTSLGSTAVLGAKWLRVAQREHYIAGSVLKMAKLWSRKRPINFALAVVIILVSVAIIAAGTVKSFTAVTLLPALIALSALASIWPLGLALRAEPKLVFTRRLKTLLAIAATILAFTYAAAHLLAGPVAGLAVLPVGALISLEAALLVATPIEARIAQKFVDTATKKLRRVAPKVVAVTGSWGKTSTKNHIRDLIEGSFSVMATPASWNNRAGLSRAINERLDSGTEIFVAEMGMYKPGEISELCTWVKPSIAVVTTVGPMHLEHAGSLEAIAAAKSEIVTDCDIAVLWVEDPLVASVVCDAVNPEAVVVKVGYKGTPGLDLELTQISADEKLYELALHSEPIGTIALTNGLHAANVGCAVAAAISAGVPAKTVASNLGSLSQPDNRGALAHSETGVVVFDDTFNANPAGAAKAVKRLVDSVEGRRVLVTPGMVELGSLQTIENQKLAALAYENGVELIAVGLTNRRSLLAGHSEALPVKNRAEAAGWVRANLKKGDAVLWVNDLPDHYP